MDQEPHTGRVYVGDLGTSRFEEINDASTPANFGWPTHEGPAPIGKLKYFRSNKRAN
jgi:glucose/arabinose dehydrogenase